MKTLLDSDNLKAILVWVLMCVGLSIMVGVVVKLFSPNQPATTINQYFVNNQEVTQYGFPKQLNGY